MKLYKLDKGVPRAGEGILMPVGVGLGRVLCRPSTPQAGIPMSVELGFEGLRMGEGQFHIRFRIREDGAWIFLRRIIGSRGRIHLLCCCSSTSIGIRSCSSAACALGTEREAGPEGI